jgi:PadR family transcriptional regulator, regulatory protein PadR
MKGDDSRSLFPGALEMMILETLRRGPLHGYAIAQSIKHSSEELLRVEEGSLYPALQRMLKARWIEGNWTVSLSNRRVKEYRLTAAGRRQLAREISRFERMFTGIQKVMRPSES